MQGKLSEVSNPNISDAGSKNVTENKKKSRKPAVIAVASVAAVAVLAGGGWFVWKTYANHELAEARQACVEASESYRKAADSYSGLVDGDAATASQITVKQVADAKTVDALAEALKANEPDVVACVADSKADYESKTSLIEKNTGWYGKHEKSLENAVRAVNDSKLEKTVSDAERLLKNSDGKVADAATRDELSKAVKARDADKIAAASKKVNDSVTAKTKADEEAQRKAEEEPPHRPPHRPRRSSRIRRRNSRTRPSYSGGSTSSGGGSSSVPDFVPSNGGLGCTTDCPPSSSDGLIHH